MLYPENPTDPAFLFECKVRKKFSEMQAGLAEAFDQIRTRRYEEGSWRRGMPGRCPSAYASVKRAALWDVLV